MTLEDLFHRACTRPGNIHEHCPTLRLLASECGAVAEFGTNEAISTTALLAGQPGRLTTFDVNPSPNAETLRRVAGVTEYDVVTADSRLIDLPPVDLLFIDSLHTYEQLSTELARHANSVGRWIVCHDTEIFGSTGEDGGRGLVPAIADFLADNRDWRRVAHYPNCNGLTVLRRTTSR